MTFSSPDPEQIAQQIIQSLQNGEESEWDNMRVEIAGVLLANNDYKKTQQMVERLLSSQQLKSKINEPTMSEEDIAKLIESNGGINYYKNALHQLLDKEKDYGKGFKSKINEIINKELEKTGQVIV